MKGKEANRVLKNRLRIKASSSRNGMRRRKWMRGGGVNRQPVIVSERSANKTMTDASVAPDTRRIKANSGSTIARNGTRRRKRLRGVDRQATTASGMPANKMTPDASIAPARTTCPASVKSGCVTVTA